MRKYKQQDLVVLALVERGGWQFGYVLKGTCVRGQFCGSESDTRLYELFDKNVADAPHKETTYKIDGHTYTIETKKEGNRRMYCAYLSQKKPLQQVTFVEKDGIMTAQVSYAS